jgi:hypothetical protein
MKKLYIFLILCSPLLFSCKKDSGSKNSGYYVKYKLDGVLVTNTRANYSWIQPNNTISNMVDFQMYSNTNDNNHGLGITVQRLGGVTTGTYDSESSAYIVIADYFKNQGNTDERDFSIQSESGMPASSFTVTLTEITDSYIKGTFTGNYLHDPGYNESVQLTDGEFFVRRNN